MKQYVRPTLVITSLTFLSQVVSFLVQVVIAHRFGARSAMDAYWVAVTLPQYVVTIAVQSLGVVFLPVFIGYMEKNNEEDAWRVASGLLFWTTGLLGIIVAGGMLYARPILHRTAPGLTPESLDLATTVARWAWPTVLPSAWNNILAYLYQAKGIFGYPALAPFLGTLINLGLIMILTPHFGIVAVPMAFAANIFFQMAMLVPLLIHKKRFRLQGSWNHPGVFETARLLVPLLLSGLLVRWTPLVDRYLASQLPEGVVSHLGYAFRIAGVLSVLVSIGLTTVIFPQLAASSARHDMTGLLKTLSSALRVLWLLVVPFIFLGAVLAIPALTVLFERGAFHAADSHAVGRLLQLYLLSLGASCLSNITGRVFYALKKTKILAWVGALEAIIYAGYAYVLAHYFGARGIALSYVIYFNLSLVWQLAVLRYLLGPLGSFAIVQSMMRITVAIIPATLLVWSLGLVVHNLWFLVIGGGAAGVGVYVIGLYLLKVPEWQMIRGSIVIPGQQ